MTLSELLGNLNQRQVEKYKLELDGPFLNKDGSQELKLVVRLTGQSSKTDKG